MESQAGIVYLQEDVLELTQKNQKRIFKMPRVPLIGPNEANSMWVLDLYMTPCITVDPLGP
jgi:hypothetical protein